MNWKDVAQEFFFGASAPRVVTTRMLERAVLAARPGLSKVSLHAWIRSMVDAGRLAPLYRGVYANMRALPQVIPDECAHVMRSGAIVSLQRVLGAAGVSNNPSVEITSIVAFGDAVTPKLGVVETGIGAYRFHGMPKALVYPDTAVSDYLDGNARYPRATPEKAFLDWLYLGNTPRSWLTAPPMDVDIDNLDKKKLDRLARRMGLADALGTWREKKARYESSSDVEMNMSTRLGF